MFGSVIFERVFSSFFCRLCTIFLSDLTSFVAAILFTVHPIHIEAVSKSNVFFSFSLSLSHFYKMVQPISKSADAAVRRISPVFFFSRVCVCVCVYVILSRSLWPFLRKEREKKTSFQAFWFLRWHIIFLMWQKCKWNGVLFWRFDKMRIHLINEMMPVYADNDAVHHIEWLNTKLKLFYFSTRTHTHTHSALFNEARMPWNKIYVYTFFIWKW